MALFFRAIKFRSQQHCMSNLWIFPPSDWSWRTRKLCSKGSLKFLLSSKFWVNFDFITLFSRALTSNHSSVAGPIFESFHQTSCGGLQSFALKDHWRFCFQLMKQPICTWPKFPLTIVNLLVTCCWRRYCDLFWRSFLSLYSFTIWFQWLLSLSRADCLFSCWLYKIIYTFLLRLYAWLIT